MKKITLVALLTPLLTLSVLAGVAWAQNSMESYGEKAGLWEVKIIKQAMDGKDMTVQMTAMQDKMKQMLASMSPEQRAKMEAMMAGQGSFGANGGFKICISPAMAAKNHPTIDKDGQCQPVKIARSGNQVTYEINCTRNGHTTTGSGTSTINGDVIRSESNMTTTDAHGTHTLQLSSQMTYLGADCQGIKPSDEVMPATATH